MKIALIHDWIMSQGGAENVFYDIIKDVISQNKNNSFQESKSSLENANNNGSSDKVEYEIFTLFSQKKFIEIGGLKIKVNSVISNGFLLNKIDYRNFMPIFPILTKIMELKIKKYDPNFSFISSFAVAKNIKIGGTKNLYLHSPMQYIYDMYDEYVSKFSGIKKLIYKLSSSYLRSWDKKYKEYNSIAFNSNFTKNLAKEIYGQEFKGQVIYPKINRLFLQTTTTRDKKDYFVFIGRLVKFSKEVDKIIELFNKTGDKLIVMGSGPDEDYLKSIAGDNITFIGHIEDDLEKLSILKNSRGLINFTKESFGIVTAEALSCGVPVFGFKGGATPELVKDGMGILVTKKDDLSHLVEKFEQFKMSEFDGELIQREFREIYG